MQTEHLTVNGMSCGGCVTRVTEALKALPGIGGVEIALSTGKVDVTYDERLAQAAQMNSAIERAGYSVGPIQTDVASKSKSCRC
jgi:copper chaperone CopZ